MNAHNGKSVDRLAAAGQVLFVASEPGQVWRVVCGMVRLDQAGRHQNPMVGFALPGDLLGLECGVQGAYAFSATALTDTCLTPVQGASADDRAGLMIEGLMQTQQRLLDMAVLRRGRVVQRVKHLLDVIGRDPLSGGTRDAGMPLPYLKDVAALVDATPESVCRALRVLAEPLPSPTPPVAVRQGRLQSLFSTLVTA